MSYRLEAFLQDTFGLVQQTSGSVGRVTVEPNDSVIQDEAECPGLADELVCCIREATTKAINLKSAQGYDIPISDSYPLLKKYLRTITLYGDSTMGSLGSWVQVLSNGGYLEKRH